MRRWGAPRVMATPTMFALLAGGVWCSVGCARSARTAETAEPETFEGDDGSRCEHRRSDLETSETRSTAATAANVRRVFRLSGDKREPRRVLVCREVDTNLDGRKDVFREFDSAGQPTRESVDANYDGRLDSWSSFSGGHLRKLELDRDGDGDVDETRFYTPTGPSQVGLAKIERDTNHDGKPDRWEAFDKGRLSRSGLDLDFDGVVDRWLQGEVSSDNAASAANDRSSKVSKPQ
jgi:hypothetical protein